MSDDDDDHDRSRRMFAEQIDKRLKTFKDSMLDAHPSSQKFYVLLLDAAALHAKKQQDYGKDDDPFANVRASEEWCDSALVGIFIRITDKMNRLKSFVRNGKLANEGVQDTLLDIMVYAGIAKVLFDEAQEGSK